MLAEKMRTHNAEAWLVNTGLTGGPYGTGHRMPLTHTRSIIDAIHDGSLAAAPTETDDVFGFEVPTECPNVPSDMLLPRNTWDDKAAYDQTADKLARLFNEHFEKYRELASQEIVEAGPAVTS
jgi:phosphoenolpyruvate carboxykinase (ATP)